MRGPILGTASPQVSHGHRTLVGSRTYETGSMNRLHKWAAGLVPVGAIARAVSSQRGSRTLRARGYTHDGAPGTRHGGDRLMTTAYSGSLSPPMASVLMSRRALLAGGLGLASAAAGPRPARPVGAQEATPVAPGDEAFPAEVQLQLAAIVETALAETYTPGALVGVWIPERGTWTMAAGIGDLATAAPTTLDDHFRIASTTKTFTATVVLQLVEEGRLSLDDRLGHFITGIPNGDEITIRQLLGMSAGIYNFIYDPRIAVDYVADPLLPFSPQHVVDIVRAHGEADFPPDAEVRYSDTNYVLLGLIIAQVTSRSVAAEITDRIIRPLSLTGTSYPATH